MLGALKCFRPLLWITCPFPTVSEYEILKPFMFGLLLLLIHLNLIYPCVHVCTHACVGHTCGGQKTTYRDYFSLPTRQVLGKELIASGLAVSVTTHQAVSPSCHCYILRSPLTTSTHEPFQSFLLNTTWVMAEGWRWQGVAILETFHTRERCMAFRKETAAPINDIFTNQAHLLGNASLACTWPFRIYSRKQFIMNNLP